MEENQVAVSAKKKKAKTPEVLLNDVVLQNIFKYLGYKDLQSCRAVNNSIWLRNSKTAWWSRTKVALTKDNVEEYFNLTEINSCAQNYKLRLFRTGDHNNIWEQFGQSIKYLELNFCELGSVDEFRMVFYTKLPNLEKLVTSLLNIKTRTVAAESMEWEDPQFPQQKNLKFLKLQFNSSKMPMSWMELLSHFPNLQALETRTNLDVYKVISIIRQHDPKMLKLTHIDTQGLHKSENEESLRIVLLNPSLSFETIRIRNGICEPDTLGKILDLHAKSLKEILFLDDCARFPTQLSPGQPLPNLEKLNLSGCLFTAEFFRRTPNLTKVNLNYNGASNSFERFDSNLKINSCKDLTISIYGRSSDSTQSDLQFFLNTFPNVEILQISRLNNLEFSMICKHWTKLVSFSVPTGSEVNVFGLLGFYPNSTTKKARNPNITNLKGLHSFLMASRLRPFQQDEDRLIGLKLGNGDVVRRELRKLPNLKSFELRNYKLKKAQEWKKIFARYPVDE